MITVKNSWPHSKYFEGGQNIFELADGLDITLFTTLWLTSLIFPFSVFINSFLGLVSIWMVPPIIKGVHMAMKSTNPVKHFQNPVEYEGQLISKCLFGTFNSSKKTNEKNQLYY